MWTSIGEKPATEKAKAISAWPLTPCSRKMATRGFAMTCDETHDVGGRILSFGLNVRLYLRPGSWSSLMFSFSASAQAGLSRSFCMAQEVLVHFCCSD
jgi:hypothetical protein